VKYFVHFRKGEQREAKGEGGVKRVDLKERGVGWL